MASTTDLWHYNAPMDNYKHMVTGAEISPADYERRKQEGTLEGDKVHGWKAPLGEDEPRLPMPNKSAPPPPPIPQHLPEVRVVSVKRVLEALEQVLALYRTSPDVERYSYHVADKILALAQPIKPLVSAEVRDPKELMR